MRNKYRYISIAGRNDSPNTPISKYYLCAKFTREYTDIRSAVVLRITIPDDLIMEKLSCEDYSTTEDKRTLTDFETMPVMKLNGRWRPVPKLKNHPYETWYTVIRDEMHLKGTPDTGFMTPSKYDEYIQNRIKTQKGDNAL